MSFSFTRSAAQAAIVGFSLIAASSFAFAAGDDTIKERQGCMKANGGIMGVAVPMVKGEKPYDNAALQEAIGKMEAACANWANFWSEDSMKGASVETFAKEEIWTDKAGFEAAGGKSYTAMQALKATTDEASFKAAFPAVGAGCQGCHEKFRRPKN
jgi:cytochrome c556